MRTSDFFLFFLLRQSQSVPVIQGQRTEFPETHFCEKLQGQSSAGAARRGGGGNERENIVSPFMWHSGSEFKDERSLQFRGYKVQDTVQIAERSLFVQLLTSQQNRDPERHSWCNQTATIKTAATSTFYE